MIGILQFVFVNPPFSTDNPTHESSIWVASTFTNNSSTQNTTRGRISVTPSHRGMTPLIRFLLVAKQIQLVVEFPTHLNKYDRQNGKSSPNRGENREIFELPPPRIALLQGLSRHDFFKNLLFQNNESHRRPLDLANAT